MIEASCEKNFLSLSLERELALSVGHWTRNISEIHFIILLFRFVLLRLIAFLSAVFGLSENLVRALAQINFIHFETESVSLIKEARDTEREKFDLISHAVENEEEEKTRRTHFFLFNLCDYAKRLEWHRRRERMNVWTK